VPDTYDVIAAGAPAARTATAIMLARRGMRVLLISRARIPSDTISSHQAQVPGIARLHRRGLPGRLRAAGTPPARRPRFGTGDVVPHGRFPACGGTGEPHSPRRTVLDALAVDEAREAGATARERFRAGEPAWKGRTRPPRSGRCHRPGLPQRNTRQFGRALSDGGGGRRIRASRAGRWWAVR
jgi:flavin-dependent dehydrogenase